MKIIVFIAIIIAMQWYDLKAQLSDPFSVNPINTSPPGAAGGINSQQYWSRAGNNNSLGTNNWFGTLYNSPVYHKTFDRYRITVGHLAFGDDLDGNGRLNPVFGNNLTRVAIHRDGSKRILRPLSLLHLGYDFDVASLGIAQGGQRNWMDIGTLMFSGTDHLYVGLRQQAVGGTTGFPSTILDTPTDRQDAVICWGDNDASSAGPDNFCFVYTAPPTFPVPIANTNDGREIMRMVAGGEVGIGPVFSNANQPKSNLHTHSQTFLSLWHQFTNETLPGVAASALPGAGGTTSSADGLRIGIRGDGSFLRNGIGMLYNQEERALLFSTFANTNTATATLTQERMRIMSGNTPTFISFPLVASPLGSYAAYNPAGIGSTITRVSISHDNLNPLVRPLSLMHLGYNALVSATNLFYDGWRPWMDIGTYTSSKFDNMYVGLKAEELGGTYDAVINWGRNQDSLPNAGPDHLRFIFSTNYNSTAPADNNNANDINALEMGRFYPGIDDTSLSINPGSYTYGRFGVGDFTAAGLNQEPTHKLDVDGNGRFRLLPDSLYFADTSVHKIVMVDESGVLRWSSSVPGGIGNYCSATANPLTGDYQIPMNDFNFHFSDNFSAAGFNNVGIGTNCGALNARLVVQNPVMNVGINCITTTATPLNNIAVRGNASGGGATSSGIFGEALVPLAGNFNRGVYGHGANAGQTSYGGLFESDGISASNIGVQATATGNTQAIGVIGNANSIGSQSIGGLFAASGSPAQNAGIISNVSSATGGNNFGGAFRAVGGLNNYAVYGQVATASTPGYDPLLGGPGNYAGYFLGDVYISGSFGPSDVNMKENINSITNADSIINLLDPIYFNFKQTGQWGWLGLPHAKQSGLRAQDVELIAPAFVKENVFPTQYDSTGAVVQSSFTFKTIDYDKFIPLLLSSNKNLNGKVSDLKNDNDSLISVISSLDDRLTALENCISALNLCDGPAMIAPNNNSNSSNNNATNVELKDAQTLILDQNVPNPFAEMTTIAYTLTDGVQKAQMLFYNATGKLINSLDLQTTSGKGQLNVFANDLSNGIYTYTLVVDGKIIDTKRMVKNK